jgi:AcrR family transcriptional regulator
MKSTRAYSMTNRAAKADETRARIRACAIELYCERPAEDFTLDEVAKRAGVTVRTILRAYPSKDELVYAAVLGLADGGVYLKPLSPGDVRAAVSAYFDIYESIGDLVMQRLNDERRLPGLKPLLDKGRASHHAGLREVFAPQLAARRGAERAALFNMLVVLTDIYVWKVLRRDLSLGRKAAEALVRRMIVGVLEEGEAYGADSLAQLVGRRQPAAKSRRRTRADGARP